VRAGAVLLGLLAALALSSGPAAAHPHGNWGSVYRSVDGGRIWEDLSRRQPVATVHDLSAARPPQVWAATGQGLLRTEDNGRTWMPVGPRAIGDVVTVVDEDPRDGSVLAGGDRGVYRAPADLSVWERVVDASAGRPLQISRDGREVTVRTTRSLLRSTDGGRTFTAAGDASRWLAGLPTEGLSGHEVLAAASAGETTVAGTADGAFASTGGGEHHPIKETDGLAVHAVHPAGGSFLLGTSRGLVRYDPARERAETMKDIPPFLAVGAIEASATRPDELYIATSVRPYPTDGPRVAESSSSGWPAAALALLAGLALAVGRRRRRRRLA
jgi:MYXO-CTERM domain-containing protein